MATRTISTIIELDGEAEFKKQMSSVNSELRTLKSEMRLNEAQFKGQAKSVEALTAKDKLLRAEIERQNTKVKASEDILKTAQEAQKNLAEAVEKVTQKVSESGVPMETLRGNTKDLTEEEEKLKKELDDAEDAYDKITKKVNEYQQTVNRSKVDLINLNSELDTNTGYLNEAQNSADGTASSIDGFGKEAKGAETDTDDFGESVSGVKEKVSVFGDVLKANLASEAISAGINALADGAKKAADAFVDLTKDALESYSQYEQLVGGVETLFDDSAGQVEDYARSAYQTAGLSANAYMETVTGFSASLISSLGGDTAKAAEMADMAITDMSDNANKMGTDMTSIQNAYQGFAKQNYTMLDNLKLGYGGTQEEMERLLEDAERLSGQEYDISSFSDIVAAIHEVQTEMGITGTTAQEASSTIEGSTNAMKAAWENLVTGLGDENADMEELTEDFIDSLITAGENVIPRIGKIVDGMGEEVEDLQPILDQLSPYAKQALDNMVQKFKDSGPEMGKEGVELIVQLLLGLAEALPELGTAAGDIVITIVQAMWEHKGEIGQIGANIILGIWNGIDELLGWFWEKVTGIATGVVNRVKKALGIQSPSKVFASIGEYMMEGLAIGMEDSKGEVMETADDIVDEIKTRFDGLTDVLSGRQDVGDLQYELWERTYGQAATETEKYDKKLELLNGQLEDQEAIVETANEAYKAVAEQYGENSAESMSYQQTLLKEELEYYDLLDSINEVITAKEALAELDSGGNAVSAANVNNLTTTNKSVTAEDLTNTAAGVVNGIAGAVESSSVTVNVPLYIDGKEFYRASLDDLRFVQNSTPEVTDDG